MKLNKLTHSIEINVSDIGLKIWYLWLAFLQHLILEISLFL